MTDGQLPNEPMDLSGQLLIAMPGMGDPRFEHTVIYICSHTDEGAMGLIVNRPAEDVGFDDVMDRLNITLKELANLPAVHVGGPVETSRGFVLHSDEYRSKLQSLSVAEGFAMTATQDILEDIATGSGPQKVLFALGYAGWAPGQLEKEIGQNGWLTAQATIDLVFNLANAQKWAAALKLLGIDPLLLSAAAGRA